MASISSIPQAVLLELKPPPDRTRVDSAIYCGLMATLLFGPLAFGAVEPWARLAQQSCAALVASACILRRMAKPDRRFHPNPLYWPWAALAALVILQVGLRIPPYLHAELTAALAAGALFLLFFVSNEMFANPARVRSAANVLTIFGFALSLWSICQAFIAPGKLLGFRTPRLGGIVYGPYMNHSHYAGLMEMLAPFALIFALRRNLPLEKRWLYAGAAFVMAASIFLSESRGGMLALLVELAVIAAIVLFQRGARPGYLWIAAVICAFSIFLLWAGADELAAHLSTFRHPGVSTHIRMVIGRDTLRMTAARPWLGWGLGNFPVAYPQFRSFYGDEFVNAAHNDYLQYAAELGLAGGLAILWFLISLLRSASRHVAHWSADSVRAAKLAALIGIIGLLAHSFADFNLQVPANAAIFVALCAMCTVRGRGHV